MEGQWVNCQRGHGHPRVIDASREKGLARVVRSHRGAAVTQIAEKVMPVLIEMCQNSILLPMGPHSCMLYTAESYKLQWAPEHQNCTTEHWNKVAWSDELRFIYIMWTAGSVCVTYLGKRWHQDVLCEEGKLAKAVWCLWQCNILSPLRGTIIVSRYFHSSVFMGLSSNMWSLMQILPCTVELQQFCVSRVKARPGPQCFLCMFEVDVVIQL